MKTIFLVIASVISFLSCIAQHTNVDELDKSLASKVKGKLKKVTIGTKATGTAIYYYKSNKSVFSIYKNKTYGVDSVSSFSTYFQNDTLFRIVIIRYLRNHSSGKAIIYLAGNNLIDQKITGTVFVPDVPTLIDSSYKMLENAKAVIAYRHE